MIWGRKETFALEARPVGAGPEEGDPSAAATWAAFRMVVEGRNLFRNVSAANKSLDDDLYWPAIGLARWFVRAWGDLYHTGPWLRPSTARNARDFASILDQTLADAIDAPDSLFDSRDRFVATHSLRAGAWGGAMPDVWIARDGPVVSIAWHDSMDGEIYFTLSRGECDVPATAFAEAVHGFVSWTLGLLESPASKARPEDLRLLREWVEDFRSEDAAETGLLMDVGMSEKRFCDLATDAGLEGATATRFFGLPPGWRKLGTLADYRDSALAVAFRCVAPVLSNRELLLFKKA
ncbi:MAG: hypothetical protein GXP62_16660, partial [Oligoflexia bacterium]|nr:hypothetical protein [Oligoflexia bacterium]